MNIPAYPEFRPLEIGDLGEFNQAFKSHPPEISEFTFTNLYAWRETYQFRVSILNGLMILRSESKGKTRFFNPIGGGDINAAIERVLDDTAGIFIRLPEATGSLFQHDPHIKIELDRDNSDYLYKMSDLVNLLGKKYDGKRNLIKKFKSTQKYEYVKLGPENCRECFEFMEEWCTIKDCDGVEGLNDERRAIRQMVENFSLFELLAGAIRVGGKIRAVAIGQRLNAATLVMDILKADPNIPGLYQAIQNEFLSREGGNFEFANLEQDLGIDGLRKSKLSYHPFKIIQKFTLANTPA